MRKLSFPSDLPDAIEIVRGALPASRPLKAAEEERLRVLFDTYARERGRGDRITAAPEFKGARGTDMRNAYAETYEGGTLNHLRHRLLSVASNRCPMCGGARPTQLDHHLPKTTYAEFALFLLNLVPCCPDCNRKKSAQVAAAVETAFLHPYLDEIPDVPILRVQIEVGKATLRVSLTLDPDAEISEELKARIAHQHRCIDLNARLLPEIGEVLTEYGDIVRTELAGAEVRDVQAYLLRDAERWDRMHGRAFWKGALLRALAADVAFCMGTPMPPLRASAA